MLATIVLACGAPNATLSPAAPQDVLSLTSGVRPVGTVPDAAAPVRAAWRGSKIALLARQVSSARLDLHEFDTTTSTFKKTSLDLEDAGQWVGFGVDAGGTAWIAVRDALHAVDPSGVVTSFVLPPVRFALPSHLRAPGPIGAPTGEIGFATSLAVLDGALAIGRADAVELLVFDTGPRSFRQLPLPPGTGDIAEIVPGPGRTVFFTVNRSGTTRGLLNDALRIADLATGDIRTISLPSRAHSGLGGVVAVGATAISVLDGSGAPTRPTAPAQAYDLRRLTLRADGTVVVRVNGTHELAVIDHRGLEIARLEYAVPIVKLMRGTPQPYVSSLAFLLPGTDNAVWFSLDGRPELYRLH